MIRTSAAVLAILILVSSPIWAGERSLTPDAFDRFGGIYMKMDDKGDIWTAYYDLSGGIRIRNAAEDRTLFVNEGRGGAPGGIGFDVQGSNIYVVWREKPGGKKLWFRASYDGGKTLSVPILLDELSEPLPRVKITSNARGDVAVIFLGEAKVDNSKYGLYFTSSHDFGKTFSAVQNLTLGYENAVYPMLFADGDNLYTYFDANKNNKRYMVFRSSSDRGRTWSAPLEIRESGAVLGFVEAGRVGNRLHVLWLEGTEGASSVNAAFSVDGGQTWKSRVLQEMQQGGIGLMRVAYDEPGYVYLAYSSQKDDKEKPRIFLMRSTDNGETWEQPVTLRRYPYEKTKAEFPQIVTDGKGTVVIAWVDYRNIRSNLYMQVSKDFGKTWLTKDIPLEEPGRFNTAHYPLTGSLARSGATYYAIAYRFRDDFIASQKADMLLIDFSLPTGGVQ